MLKLVGELGFDGVDAGRVVAATARLHQGFREGARGQIELMILLRGEPCAMCDLSNLDVHHDAELIVGPSAHRDPGKCPVEISPEKRSVRPRAIQETDRYFVADFRASSGAFR